MATRYAVATGNWSNTATWDGGTLPTSADDVFADGKTVTIDQNVTVLSIRSTTRSGGIAGGSFTVSGAYTITCTGLGILAGTTDGITVTATTGTTVNIISNIFGGTTANTIGGVNFTGTGTLNITGNVTGTAQNSGGLRIGAANSTTNITGNLGASGGANQQAVRLLAAATLNVTGTLDGSGFGNTGSCILIDGNATLNVTGAATAGTVGVPIQVNSGSPTATVNGTLTSAGVVAINGLFTLLTVTGPFICGSSGRLPISTTGVVRLSPIANNEFRFQTGSGTSSLFSSDVNSGAPTANNVRSGTVYGGGTLTGTLAVPSPSYVALGVATDNTVGSLAYNSDSAIADYLWNKQTSAITTAGSIGERLKNAATVDTVGSQIAAFDGL